MKKIINKLKANKNTVAVIIVAVAVAAGASSENANTIGNVVSLVLEVAGN